MISLTDHSFVEELKREFGREHFLYNRRIRAVAKCESNDDILYLTCSAHNSRGFPEYGRFCDIEEVGMTGSVKNARDWFTVRRKSCRI